MMRTDLNLHAAVSGTLRSTLGPAASEVVVAVRDSVVTLSGTVATPRDKVAAEEAVQRLAGVHAVVDALHVIASPNMTIDDETLARRAVDALAAGAYPIGRNVAIRVENGWLNLTGTVTTPTEYAAVERALECVEGARGMRSEVRVVEPQNAATQACKVAP